VICAITQRSWGFFPPTTIAAAAQKPDAALLS
jgi:hypothetical protein